MGVYVIVQKLLRRTEAFIQNNWLLIIACAIICILLAGAGGYYAGHSSGRADSERDANTQRVQQVNKQLERTSDHIERAKGSNAEARTSVRDLLDVNERIEFSINEGARANEEARRAVEESKRLVGESKVAIGRSDELISDSAAILERARAISETREEAK